MVEVNIINTCDTVKFDSYRFTGFGDVGGWRRTDRLTDTDTHFGLVHVNLFNVFMKQQPQRGGGGGGWGEGGWLGGGWVAGGGGGG